MAGDGPNPSPIASPRLVSCSQSSSMIAAADQEWLGVLLGGELRPRLGLIGDGVWRSVSWPFFCSWTVMSIPGSDVAFLFQRALTCSQVDSWLASLGARPRRRIDGPRRTALTPTSRSVG